MHRLLTATLTAIVVTATGAGTLSVLDQDATEGPPTPKPAGHQVGGLRGPVWADEAGVHVGGLLLPVTAYELAGVRSLGLVRNAVVYLRGDAGVYLHEPGRQPRRIGGPADVGPVGDPRGSVAAWIEGRELVAYDTEAGVELSRVQIGRVGSSGEWAEAVGFVPEHPILSVGPDRVRVEAGRRVWDFDPAGERRPLRAPVDAATLIDSERELDVIAGPPVRDRMTRSFALTRMRFELNGRLLTRYGPVFKEGSLSSDGRYLATATGYDKGHRLVVVDVRTGVAVPLHLPELDLVPGPSPWGWAYGDTLMVVMVHFGRSREGVPRSTWLVSCDMSAQRCRVQARAGSWLTVPN